MEEIKNNLISDCESEIQKRIGYDEWFRNTLELANKMEKYTLEELELLMEYANDNFNSLQYAKAKLTILKK